jgi:hypothetical protein
LVSSLRSAGARVVLVVTSYKHAAPAEQRPGQLSTLLPLKPLPLKPLPLKPLPLKPLPLKPLPLKPLPLKPLPLKPVSVDAPFFEHRAKARCEREGLVRQSFTPLECVLQVQSGLTQLSSLWSG